MEVVAIVCAKNEATRIGRVLSVLVPMVPVLVVDDGSTDRTADVAEAYGASVLRLPQNIGKGRAMLEGVRATDADFILFVDADLIGFREDHVQKILDPILSGAYEMVVGMRDYGEKLNPLVQKLPLISGERAVSRRILDCMPDRGWRGFGVETWLNHTAAVCGARVGTVLLDGMQIVKKWEKEPEVGFPKMLDMGAEIIKAHDDAAKHIVSGPWDVSDAPAPATLAAKGASTDDVMRQLSQTLVEVGGPYVRDQLWTPEARRDFGDAVGKRLAKPIWVLATTVCTVFFGPVAGAGMAVAGLVSSRLGSQW
jgi:polyisoprenyl-phosphate glycosyltransferase